MSKLYENRASQKLYSSDMLSPIEEEDSSAYNRFSLKLCTKVKPYLYQMLAIDYQL